jgi:hypothetical protein
MAYTAVSGPSGVLDMAWWAEQGCVDWRHLMGASNPDSDTQLQRCTYSGRPFGGEAFVGEMSERLGRYWKRAAPPNSRKPRQPHQVRERYSENRDQGKQRSSG